MRLVYFRLIGSPEGRRVLVNVDHVYAVEPLGASSCVLMMLAGQPYRVEGTLEQIGKELRNARGALDRVADAADRS